MKILVLNAGSSSVKYELFDMSGPVSLASGSVERIGEDRSSDHVAAFEQIAALLAEQGLQEDDLAAVGHRVVHGGDVFEAPTLLDDDAIRHVRDLVSLAPLHNPPNLAGIDAARRRFPGVPHVAVFDTAFHATMPGVAKRYAIPSDLQRERGVRRYGFHGTSYQYVTRRAAELLDKPVDAVNLIALHLGNGASASAIHNGKSVDTTMGFTPLEGLVMGTRSGDIDPAVVFHLHREAGLSLDEIDELLNQQSGLKGLCGDSDMRNVLGRIDGGDARAREAVDLYCYRIRKTIGAYVAVLGRVDALVFTAGVGENRPEIREQVCRDLGHLGIRIDESLNRALSGADGFIDDGTGTRLLVIHTNEALEIANQCADLLAT